MPDEHPELQPNTPADDVSIMLLLMFEFLIDSLLSPLDSSASSNGAMDDASDYTFTSWS